MPETTSQPLDITETIDVFGAREHNLKNVDLTIPRNKLVVITGISGSGKSSWRSIRFTLKASGATWKAFRLRPWFYWLDGTTRRGQNQWTESGDFD